MMQFRKLTAEEHIERDKLESLCFEMEYNPDEKEPWQPSQTTFGAFDDNVVAACVTVNHFECNFNGAFVPMAGIGGVCTLPTHRKGGFIRELMKMALTGERDAHTPLAALYPFSSAYYGKFGFADGVPALRVTATLEHLKTRGDGDGFVLCMPEASVSAMNAVYDSMGASYNLFTRSLGRPFFCLKDPYKHNTFAYASKNSCIVFKKREEGGESVMQVEDIVFTSPEALQELFGFVRRFAADYTQIDFPLPPSFDLDLITADRARGLVCVKHNRCFMQRVVNVQAALKAASYAVGGIVVVEVSDSFLNTRERFAVDILGGSALSVEPVPDDRAADFAYDIRELSKRISGVGDTLLASSETYLPEYF